jgi:hypothetical protein
VTSLALAALAAIALASPLSAQDQTGAAPKPTVTPLKVTVTISRYQGDKKISSLPYTLSVNIVPGQQNNIANLRIGTKVPITSSTRNERGDTQPSITYQDVGTSIDCFVSGPDETGRYRLSITIDESSVYDSPAARGLAQPGRPTLRSFRRTDSLMLKDGQSAELSNTPDKLTGETVRVEVAVAVVK